MKRMLINATQKEELRIALINGKDLFNLNIETINYKKRKSNIYKGKIIHIESSLEAAFVDYGYEKHGFLPLKEISEEYFPEKKLINNEHTINNILYKGQEIIVQVHKEERGDKGASLTTFISLAGNYLILMPNKSKLIGISQSIQGKKRAKLRETLSTLMLPKKISIIIRTSGIGKSFKEIEEDFYFILKKWKIVQKKSKKIHIPSLIYQEENIVIRTFRDYLQPDINEILIDNPKIFFLAKEQFSYLGKPNFIKKIKLYEGKIPLFSFYQIESQIQSAFQRKVQLPSGGSIIIDSTEALTAIDINSEKSTTGIDIKETALKNNLEAAKEIAKQLRLRDLGGLIVIDFIDMISIEYNKNVEIFFKTILQKDKAHIKIGKISKFGLLELSRQRINPSLKEINNRLCPRCEGTGNIRNNKSFSLSILRIIEEEISKNNTSEIHVTVPVLIASYLLNEKRKEINNIENKQQKKKILIIPNSKIQTPHYSIMRIKKKTKTLIKKSFNNIQNNNPKKNTINKINNLNILNIQLLLKINIIKFKKNNIILNFIHLV